MITETKNKVLKAIIQNKGEMRLEKIAEVVGISKRVATSALNRLKNHGLVVSAGRGSWEVCGKIQ